LASHSSQQGKALHGALLQLPVIGPCLRSFALARFSWAYALTQQAGMDVAPSLEASLKATDNAAFAAAAPQITQAIMAGENFTDGLGSTGLFPADYLAMVDVGETSGTVPETLQRLSPQLEEQARRSLSGLTTALGWLIWAGVAALIIFLIFRLAGFYVNMINTAGQL
jgi:type IV pilus assembly protein PilC